ncbi:uncharacterized protein CCR75_003322 [Bremia lactucae]|uniref:Uncharacterized protein n=1 Tax=Bremia lactucae TaxID=4779 RepID=A0A976ILG4_BRELC|nr:hypothetical protein CCR75_003322 [Bremia lactucae]
MCRRMKMRYGLFIFRLLYVIIKNIAKLSATKKPTQRNRVVKTRRQRAVEVATYKDWFIVSL